MSEREEKLLCWKCRRELEPKQTFFHYLGHSFQTDILCCPGCGQVFIPEDLARGRMSQVERELEDK